MTGRWARRRARVGPNYRTSGAARQSSSACRWRGLPDPQERQPLAPGPPANGVPAPVVARSPEEVRRRPLHGPDRHAGPAPLGPDCNRSVRLFRRKRRYYFYAAPRPDRPAGAALKDPSGSALPHVEGWKAVLIRLSMERTPGSAREIAVPPLSAPEGMGLWDNEKDQKCLKSNVRASSGAAAA